MVSLFTGGHMNPDTMRQLLQLLVHDASLVTDALVDERMAVCREQPREVLSTMQVPNLTERLGEIQCPVLGFWGTEDQFNPAGGAMKFLAGCADARFVMINRCGHWVMVEHADYFNRECLASWPIRHRPARHNRQHPDKNDDRRHHGIPAQSV